MNPPGVERASPPDTRKGGPTQAASSQTVAQTADEITIRRGTVRACAARLCVHGRPRFCAACVGARRRVIRQLDALVDESRPAEAPSSFSLSHDELRRHGNELVECGWAVDEVRLVLAVEPAGTP